MQNQERMVGDLTRLGQRPGECWMRAAASPPESVDACVAPNAEAPAQAAVEAQGFGWYLLDHAPAAGMTMEAAVVATSRPRANLFVGHLLGSAPCAGVCAQGRALSFWP